MIQYQLQIYGLDRIEAMGAASAMRPEDASMSRAMDGFNDDTWEPYFEFTLFFQDEDNDKMGILTAKLNVNVDNHNNNHLPEQRAILKNISF